MIGDFNIRDSDWDPFFLHHLVYTDTLLEIADFFDLKQFISVNQVSTKYVDNPNELNFVINLMFLKNHSEELNTYLIIPNLRILSNHTSLVVNIAIHEEFIQEK